MKIIVIRNNYPAYNKEASRPLIKPETPAVETKSDAALLKDGKPFFIPDFTSCCTFGAALVVRICRLGKSIPARFAHRYYDSMTVGIDFTAEDMRQQMETQHQPWDLSHDFDGSAVIGDFRPVGEHGLRDIHFHLEADGVTVQQGCTADMCFTVDEIIAYVSRFHMLRQGDLIYTGMPSPALTAHIDQHLTGYINDDRVLAFNVK